MGAGDRMSVSSTNKKVLERVPFEKPSFGLGDLKKAIPPHCFKRSLIRSFATVFHDIAIIYTFYYIAANYIPLLPLYWICQGSMLMAFWCIGHECGHHAFSDYQWIDDAVGFFVHSICLTPYFSFKYSHRSHHAHTNSIEHDEVYIPKRKSDKLYSEFLNNSLGVAFKCTLMVTIGQPLYYCFNVLGRKYEAIASHFYPQSPIFKNRERPYILLSDVGILAVLYALYHFTVTQRATWAFCVYIAPLVAEGGLFIVLGYLNHTHPSIPHHDSTEWDWLRGCLSTIDRDYGFLTWVLHRSTDTHVLHHFFPAIPHTMQ